MYYAQTENVSRAIYSLIYSIYTIYVTSGAFTELEERSFTNSFQIKTQTSSVSAVAKLQTENRNHNDGERATTKRSTDAHWMTSLYIASDTCTCKSWMRQADCIMALCDYWLMQDDAERPSLRGVARNRAKAQTNPTPATRSCWSATKTRDSDRTSEPDKHKKLNVCDYLVFVRDRTRNKKRDLKDGITEKATWRPNRVGHHWF